MSDDLKQSDNFGTHCINIYGNKYICKKSIFKVPYRNVNIGNQFYARYARNYCVDVSCSSLAIKIQLGL